MEPSALNPSERTPILAITREHVLQALATGHEGCMTTVHAKAADEALVRLEGMALQSGLPLAAVRAQLAVGMDVFAVLSRRPDGRRGLTQIGEVAGAKGTGSPAIRMLWLEDGDHDIKPRKAVSGFTAAGHLATMAREVAAWAGRLPG